MTACFFSVAGVHWRLCTYPPVIAAPSCISTFLCPVCGASAREPPPSDVNSGYVYMCLYGKYVLTVLTLRAGEIGKKSSIPHPHAHANGDEAKPFASHTGSSSVGAASLHVHVGLCISAPEAR